MTRTETRLLMAIVLMGLTLRLCWAFGESVSIDRLPDQQEYLNLGRNLLQHHALFFFDSRFGQDVYAYRMPGYPVLVAMCGGSIRAVRVVQSLIDVSTIVAVFLIAGQVAGGVGVGTRFSVPLVAAGAVALNPFYVYFSGLILTETAFTALLAWAIVAVLRGRWIIAALILTVGCYLRPSGLIFVPVLTALSFMNNQSAGAYRLRNAAIAMVITFVCLIPWAVRNHYILRSWVFTATNGGVTALDGFHDHATGGSDQRFIADFPSVGSMNEVERTRFFSQHALDWIRKHPMEIPRLSVKKIVRGWSPVPLSAEFGKPIYRWISALYAVPFDGLCLVGLFSSRLTGRAKILLTIPAILVTVLQIISVGSIRYRIPAEAPLAVVAAVGAADLFKRLLVAK